MGSIKDLKINVSTMTNLFLGPIANQYEMLSDLSDEIFDFAMSDDDLILRNVVVNMSMKEISQKVYGNTIRNYEQITALAARLVKELGLPNNEISYSIAVERLIHEGKLSEGLVFNMGENYDLLRDITGYYGIDVVNGYGCCRHAAGIHQDIFQNLGLRGDAIYCLIKYGASNDEILFGPANHAVNLVKYGNVLYVHDLLRRGFSKFENKYIMSPYHLSLDINSNMYYKPLDEIIYIGRTKEEVLRNIEDFDRSSKCSHLSVAELREIINETNSNYDKNGEAIDDFRNAAKIYMKKIIS